MGAMLTQFHLRAQGQSQESYMDGRKLKLAKLGKVRHCYVHMLCTSQEIKQPLQKRMSQLLWPRPCSFIPPEGQVDA